jgi:hypothetical protein
LDPGAWDLLRIHNHAVARVAAARPPTRPAPADGLSRVRVLLFFLRLLVRT